MQFYDTSEFPLEETMGVMHGTEKQNCAITAKILLKQLRIESFVLQELKQLV